MSGTENLDLSRVQSEDSKGDAFLGSTFWAKMTGSTIFLCMGLGAPKGQPACPGVARVERDPKM